MRGIRGKVEGWPVLSPPEAGTVIDLTSRRVWRALNPAEERQFTQPHAQLCVGRPVFLPLTD